MSWVKIDDGFAEHPKIAALTDAAFRAHVTALTYASRNLTDGFVPANIAKQWATPKVIDELSRQLWKPDGAGSGFHLHDFLDYNPSRREVLTKRQDVSNARSKAGSKGAAKRWQNDGPDPDPDPDPDDPDPDPDREPRARGRAGGSLPDSFALKPVEDRDFPGQYVWHCEQGKGKHPGGAAVAAASQLERTYGLEACVQVATDLNWEFHPNYYQPILEDRKNGRVKTPERSNGRSQGRYTDPDDPTGIADWKRYQASPY